MTDKIEVSPLQLLAFCTIEMQVNQLATASAQMKHHGVSDASGLLRRAAELLMAEAEKMKADWSRKVVVAQPADVPKLVTP